MKQLSSFSRVMDAVNHSKNRVIGAETFLKDGTMLKSLMSRGNFLRKVFLSAVCFIFLACACFAQDVIITKDKKKFSTKVTEVNEDNVKYKHKDGVREYTLQKSDIAAILYENGQMVTFGSFDMYQMLSKREYKTYIFPGMRADYPELYSQYKSGGKLFYGGVAVLFVGAGCLTYTAIGYKEWDDGEGKSLKDSHLYALYAGIPIALGGIIIAASGEMKQRRSLDDYSYQLHHSSISQLPKPYFRLNVYPNRVGIAYVF